MYVPLLPSFAFCWPFPFIYHSLTPPIFTFIPSIFPSFSWYRKRYSPKERTASDRGNYIKHREREKQVLFLWLGREVTMGVHGRPRPTLAAPRTPSVRLHARRTDVEYFLPVSVLYDRVNNNCSHVYDTSVPVSSNLGSFVLLHLITGQWSWKSERLPSTG